MHGSAKSAIFQFIYKEHLSSTIGVEIVSSRSSGKLKLL